MPPADAAVEPSPSSRLSLTRFALLSIAAAIFTFGLKGGAYLLTNSVGLLSDALESLVNLAAALLALLALWVASRPPDAEREYGYDKAEYFASGAEGTLIVVAAFSIAAAAIRRLLDPQPLEQLGLGLAISVAAALVNLSVALVLLRAGRRHRSITLEADAHHLLTDVWTSAGVVLAVGAVELTSWQWLDPVIALVVAFNIVWAGGRLVGRSVRGLMDTALPEADQAILRKILDQLENEGVRYHALRTRQAASRRFVSVHILVPGRWTVQRAHDLAERVEGQIRAALANTTVMTHLEPLEDPVSFRDQYLERTERQ